MSVCLHFNTAPAPGIATGLRSQYRYVGGHGTTKMSHHPKRAAPSKLDISTYMSVCLHFNTAPAPGIATGLRSQYRYVGGHGTTKMSHHPKREAPSKLDI